LLLRQAGRLYFPLCIPCAVTEMVKVEHYSDRKDICHRLSSGVTPLVRAKALPERMEAPAGLARSGLKPSLSTWKPLRGWRVGYPGHMPMVFEEIIRYSPRRRASPRLAEGFSPTAKGAYRMYFSISISPP
jgi:hypothetical protein